MMPFGWDVLAEVNSSVFALLTSVDVSLELPQL